MAWKKGSGPTVNHNCNSSNVQPQITRATCDHDSTAGVAQSVGQGVTLPVLMALG